MRIREEEEIARIAAEAHAVEQARLQVVAEAKARLEEEARKEALEN